MKIDLEERTLQNDRIKIYDERNIFALSDQEIPPKTAMEVKLSRKSKDDLLMINHKKSEDLWLGDKIVKKNQKIMVLNTANKKRTICKNEVVALGNNIGFVAGSTFSRFYF